MKPLIAVLRRIGVRLVIYLNDILIMNQSKGGINARQGFPDSPTSSSRVGDKLEKISHTTKPSNRILGIRTRLQGDGSIIAKAKSRQNYQKMSRRPKFGPSSAHL